MIRHLIALGALLASAPAAGQSLTPTGIQRQLSTSMEQMQASTAAQINAAMQQMQSQPGRKGDTGDPGPAGPPGAPAANQATFLPNATVAETATLAIVLGPRTVTVPVAGIQVGDRVLLTPAAAMPAGYVLGDAYCATAGVLTLDFYGPAIALGASRSFTVRVTVFR